ncbi:pneumococcal-type histidine triad protein [Streptococcus marimammalium]|uniref:pneumococcal-type histidine triad protein n=1 Tax=Streptococcus marimammalium TaxID=269666 RepID=UPI00036CC857|nr:pneumococcal-type histidine triad protein [Streptococcus marimammalium]
MKKKYIISSAAAAVLLAVGVGVYQSNQMQEATKNDNTVAYVDGGKKQSKTSMKSENKTQEQINEEEGISAEQIVVKITDDGYVTSHGDHYHYYNGKVPFDSLISEDLIMNDPNYTFNQADVVNEVADGYIIKVNGNYYLYIKDGSKRKNVRTKEQIEEQKEKGTLEASQKAHKSSKSSKKQSQTIHKNDGRYRTDDGYVFSPTDVIEDTGDGFIVPHGDHFHYIPKNDLSSSELAQAQAYWDRKTGKVSQITQKGSAQQNSASHSTASTQSSHKTNQGISQGTGNQKTKQHTNHSQTPHQSTQNSSQQSQQSQNQEESIDNLLKQLYALPKNQRHVESDGLVFDPKTIYKWQENGVVVPHGDHYHYIPYTQMSTLEEKISKQLRDDNQSKDNNQSKDDNQSIDNHQHDEIDHDNSEKDVNKGELSSKEIFDKLLGKFPIFSEEDSTEDDTVEDDTSDETIDNNDDKTTDNEVVDSDHNDKAMREVGRHLVPEDAVLDENYDYRGWTAQEIYEAIQGKAIITPEDMLYGLTLATEYKDGVFIIPHTDHYHYIQLKWLDKDPEIFIASDKTYNLNQFLATAKYYMENPDKRPKKDGWGEDADIHKKNTDKKTDHDHDKSDHHDHHDDEENHPVTPLSEREGKPNSQIVYSAKEVADAKKAGKYATSDGYIFDAKDIIKDEGEAYITPHMGHEHWIPKNELSKEELKSAEEFWKNRNKIQESNETNASKEKPQSSQEKDVLLNADDLNNVAIEEKLKAQAIFERVKAEKIVPVENIKANMVHTVRYSNGYLIIPHLDHYHNVPLSWYDKNWYPPTGYTLAQLFATVKYYMEHPEEAPVQEGWGTDAQEKEKSTDPTHNNYGFGREPIWGTDDEEEEDEEEEIEEEDEFDVQMRTEGERHGISGDEYLDKLSVVAAKYKVAYDKVSFHSTGFVTVLKDDGTTVTVNLFTAEELSL